MGEWYVLATPLAILGVLVLFRFIGCSSFGADDTKVEQAPPPDNRPDYRKTVLADGPVSYWRFQEGTGAAPPSGPATPLLNTPVSGGTAKDEQNTNNGTYKKVIVQPPAPPPPQPADSPTAPGSLTLQAAGLLEVDGPNTNFSMQVDGGYVEVPYSNSLKLASFTVEALVRPEWDPNEKGLYRTVIALNAIVTPPAPNPTTAFGFGLFAGPIPGNPTSQDVWQIWLADGTDFKPIKDPTRDFTAVDFTKTNYLAVTYDGTTQKLNMYVYVRGIDLDSGVAHPVKDVTAAYKPLDDNTKSLLIGMHRPPIGSAISLYHPFKGRIQEVAVYNKVVSIGQCPTARVCAGLQL